MSVRAVCPGCGATYTVPESAAGKKARCRKCGLSFPVGAAPPAADDFAALAASGPPAARGKRRAPGRRRLYLAVGGGLLCLAALVAVWSLTRGGLTDADFAKLKLGMSLDEVQAVLGRGSEFPGTEVPPALEERLDNPQVKGQIDLMEARRWHRWQSSGRTVYVGLSETATGDRVTVLAFDRPGGLKLEYGNMFARGRPAAPGVAAAKPPPVGQGSPAGRPPGDDEPAHPKAKPSAEQLRKALTRENVQKLRKGMTAREVGAVLGPPAQSRVVERHAGFESRQLTWQLGPAYIIAVFHNGRLESWDSGDGNGGPLPPGSAAGESPKPGADAPSVGATYKKARLDKVLLDYHGTTQLNFVLAVGNKKVQVLPGEHVKFFDAAGKEIPQGRWGPYLREGKTVLDVTTIRMNVPQFGGEVEFITEWRLVEP